MKTTVASMRAAADVAPRRRQLATPTSQWLLVVVTVVVAIGAALVGAAPTGGERIDLVERVGAAVVMTLAGSRARRGSLIVGGVAVGVAGNLVGIVAGAVALLSASALVTTERRSRVVGAVSGGAVFLGSLHLDVDWFPYASTSVGVLACGVVLRSGYRNTPRSPRRVIRRVLAGIVLLVLLSAAVAGVSALHVRSELIAAADATERALDAVRSGETAESASTFASAEREFTHARSHLNAPWMLPARLIPVMSQNVRAVDEIATIGGALTATAGRNAPDIDYDRLLVDGGVDLELLETFRAPLASTALELNQARRVLRDQDPAWLVGPVSEQRALLESKVRELYGQARLAATAVDRVPEMFGADGARRYLILLGNPAEARDLGGHIGNWAEIVADGGRLTLAEVGVPRDLAMLPESPGISDPASLPPSYVAMRPAVFPQNWASSPDVGAVGRVSAELFEQRTGRKVDGVLYADPFTFAAFVELTGPVTVPAVVPPFELTQENAAAFLISDQYRLFADDTDGNEAVTSLVREVFDQVTRLRLPGPKALADRFSPLVASGRLRFVSMHPADDDLLDLVHLGSSTPVPDGGDLLGVINRNANPSKIDAFLRRSTEVNVQWDPRSGEVGSTVAVTLVNEAPTTGWSRTVIGGGVGQPDGTNVTDLAILSPHELLRASVDGAPAAIRSTWEGSYWRHEIRMTLPSGGTQTAVFELAGIVTPGDRYRLRTIGQPLVEAGPVQATIEPEVGSVLARSGVERVGRAGRIALTDDISASVEMRVVVE